MSSEIPGRLFRFFSTPDRDIKCLRHGSVYYPSPRQLNDPFDCQLCFDTRLEQLGELDPNAMVLGLMTLALDKTRTPLHFSTDEDLPFQQRFDYLCEDFLSCMFKYGVHSLTEHPDHPLMWSHYGAAFRGFALEYDTARPSAPGVQESTLRVSYVTEIPAFKLVDLFESDDAFRALRRKLLSTKGPSWSYENEWRVVIWAGELRRANSLQGCFGVVRTYDGRRSPRGIESHFWSGCRVQSRCPE